jgi:L-ascorbate metabolism protein UlaG (beta-lactamase superfamily)
VNRILCLLSLFAACASARAAPDHVELTWMSIANMHFSVGDRQIVADGYITRLPENLFFGGGAGLDSTRRAVRPDVAAVREVFTALGGKSAVNLLLTGHNHFDHSFDTATWAKLSGARLIGAPTTCLQVRAEKIPARRCKAVLGGEKIALGEGIEMYVVRWNHSGDPQKNAAQHNPLELERVPAHGTDGLRAGLAEDFPNGGGNRAYLFTVDGPSGRLSWFYQDSASAVDLREPIIVGGKNYGAPLENLSAAMRAAGVDSVDLWIATGGVAIADLVLPVLKPRAYLPVHWDGLFGRFKAGPPAPYADAPLEKRLAEAQVALIKPAQYMDKWRLDRTGVHPLDNSAVKAALGFN